MAMAEARGMAEWDRAAMITAAIINMHRDPKKGRAVTPAKLNPYRSGKTQDVDVKLDSRESMLYLKQVHKQISNT